MMFQRIHIESIRPDRPLTPKWELSYRVSAETYDAIENVARKMLKGWCDANPGIPATYVISGLSAQDCGESY